VFIFIYRAAFAWFLVEPGWCKVAVPGMAKEEAQAVAIFAQFLAQNSSEGVSNGEGSVQSKRSSKSSSLPSPRSIAESQVTTFSQSPVRSPLQVC